MSLSVWLWDFLVKSFSVLCTFIQIFPFFKTRIQKSANDTSNFDSEFTHEAPKLTPVDRLFLMNLDQTEFEGFTYINPEYANPVVKENV